MKEAKKEPIKLFDFIETLVLEYQNGDTGNNGRSQQFKTLLRTLKAFCKWQKRKTLDFEGINAAFFQDFETYANDVKALNVNTLKKYVKNIKTVLRFAEKRGVYEGKFLKTFNVPKNAHKRIYAQFEDAKPLEYDSNGGLTFYGFVEMYLSERANILGEGSLNGLHSRHRLLQQFAKEVFEKTALEWSDFDAKLPLKLQNWCYCAPRKHSKNYVSKILAILRTWLREAQNQGIEGVTNVWLSKSYRLENSPIDCVALSFKEVEFLANLDLSSNQRLQNIRDIFVFDCLTGLRYSDISTLEKLNFTTINKNGVPLSIIDMVTKKTGERVKVPLHGMAKEIIDRNDGELPRVPTNQKLNAYLKELCEYAEMTETIQLRKNVGGKLVVKKGSKFSNVSTHTGRRTFATIAYVHFKMPSVLIMKMTGHKSEREFMKYIQIDRTAAAIEVSDYFDL